MGIGPFHSSSVCSCSSPVQVNVTVKNEPVKGNPNPRNFVIKTTEYIVNNHFNILIALVNYPDCNNYEGDKILVFENVSCKKLFKLQTIDPHFCEEGHISPIARFEPTEEGMEMAEVFAKAWLQKLAKSEPTDL